MCLALFTVGTFIPSINNIPPFEKTLSGFVAEARDNYVLFESKFTKYYVYSKENDFELGDYLVIEGDVSDLKFTSYESRFDFGKYLNNKGVGKELKVRSIDRKFHSFIRTHEFKKSFLSKFDENTATLISAFLFNEKDYSCDLMVRADRNGLIYLFSLSGVYLNVMFAGLSYILFLKFSRKTSKILPFFILLPFAFFSFSKIGTLRVYLMYLLKYLNEFHFKKRKFSHIELVSILALFFIIIDYHLVYQEAFYIGFLLSLLSPLMHNSIKFLSKNKQKVIFPLMIRLFVLPLQLRGGYFDIFSILKSYIIFPINILFLILVMLSVIIPFYGFVNSVGSGVTWVIEKMDLVSTRIPFGNWGGLFELIFYTVFFISTYFLEGVRIKQFKFVCISLLSFFLISIIPLQNPITNYVYFVNVGQGDSIIIKNRSYTVMIDTGGNKSFDMASECLIPFMNKNKITHIDALITTHDDFDHSGAKDSLMSEFKVKKYLSSKDDFPYKIGDLYFENLNTFDFEEDNDKSLVLSLDFMNKKWLFTGDASTLVEKAILDAGYDVDCDILKVGHHGSKTSTSEEFLKATSPEEAIVSVGAKNYYGHPSSSVIDLLEKYDVKIRRTDLEGTISYFSLVA